MYNILILFRSATRYLGTNKNPLFGDKMTNCFASSIPKSISHTTPLFKLKAKQGLQSPTTSWEARGAFLILSLNDNDNNMFSRHNKLFLFAKINSNTQSKGYTHFSRWGNERKMKKPFRDKNETVFYFAYHFQLCCLLHCDNLFWNHDA